jgi:phage-related protein
MPAKRINVVFYRGEGGTEPVRNWLSSLGRADRKTIGDDIRVVEFGWPIGMPVCRPLGQGLCEVRTTLKDRIARTMFAVVGTDMVLLHGFIKKSQAAPRSAIDIARSRLKAYRRYT